MKPLTFRRHGHTGRSAVRVVLLTTVLLGLPPTGVGRAGIIPAGADGVPDVTRMGHIGTGGGSLTEEGVIVKVPRGAVSAPTNLDISTATGVPAVSGVRPVKAFTLSAVLADSRATLPRFAVPARLVVPLAGVPLRGADPADLRLANLAADRTWSVLPTTSSGGTIGAWVDTTGTFAVVAIPANGLSVGHNVIARIDGGSMRAGYAPSDTPVAIGDTTRQVRVRFQLVNGGGTPVTVTPRLEYRPVTGGGWTSTPVKPTTGAAFYADREWIRSAGPRAGSLPGQRGADIAVADLLIPGSGGSIADGAGSRSAGSGSATSGPAGTPAPADPPSPDATGSQGTGDPSASATPPAGASPTVDASGSITPMAATAALDLMAGHPRARAGHRSMGANPDLPVTLPAGGVTEQEFTVRVSTGAKPGTGYEFRLTNAGRILTGAVARVTLPPAPAKLSPNQRQGVKVDTTRPKSRLPHARTASASTSASTDTGGTDLPFQFTLSAPGGSTDPVLLVSARTPAATPPSAPLTAPAAATGAVPAAVTAPLLTTPLLADPVPPDTMNGVHGPYSITSDQCGVCHRTHDTSTANLLIKGAPQSTLCFTCHNGTGAPSLNVQAQFEDASIPADNPAAREYYGHAATVDSGHTEASADEFGGRLNRHSECGDCHNAHRATPRPGVTDPAGWGASGALNGISGVSVVNGAAGTAPSYTFLNGTDTPVTLEYQLCLKCHSGFTTLPSNTGFTPSKFELDAGVEFNPANASYHPVEAAGKNQTPAMTASLNGTSPYKLWNFTAGSTIRCVSCHASSAAFNATQPVEAGSDLPAHRSSARGILIQNYRDRVLKPATEPYSAADFALCYTCHAEEPFVNASSTATNFTRHALHVSGISGEGSGGTDIDTAGDGQGNALCAECHFRSHSTSYPAGDQILSGAGLVNFAPDVTPFNGVLSFSGGTCTLVCHGKQHDHFPY